MAVTKNRKKRSRAPKKSWATPARIVGWALALVLTAGAVFVALRLPAVLSPSALEKTPAPALNQSSPVVPAPAPAVSSEKVSPPPTVVYEEPVDDFEAKIRAVDGVILHALAAQGASPQTLRHRAIEGRSFKGQEFFYQNLTISLPGDVFPFLVEIKDKFDALSDVTMQVLNENPRDLEISIQGQPTHHLFLPLPHEPTSAPVAAAQPRLVIIMDDLGESVAVAKRLAALSFPVSFSVLPYTTKAREVARIARQHNRELLLHLPCEPEGYPKTANSGPGSLLTSMSPAVLERTLTDNLARLPEVDGVNNHMGSKMTANKQAMRIILAHLQGRGKFFVDSMTTPKSCVQTMSASLGIPYMRRHIFLDNTPKESAVLLQLKKAQSLALKTGLAIAIGHPYPETLAALETWAKQRHAELIVCSVAELRQSLRL